MKAIGCDPGSASGAVVVRISGHIAWWLVYSEVTVGARARWWDAAGPARWEAPTLARLADALAPAIRAAAGGADVLVLEGLFQAKRKGLLTLAESAGVWLAHLEPLAQEVRRPTANDWRGQVLGLPIGTDAARAEEYAIRWARRHLTWEHPPDGLTRIEEGAVCEAACMAGAGMASVSVAEPVP